MIQIERIPAGIYAANCYIIYDDQSLDAVMIDPAGDYPKLKKYLDGKSLNLKAALLTHGHGDHIGAVESLRSDLKTPIYVHLDDEEMIQSAKLNLSGSTGGAISFDPDHLIADNEKLVFGALEFKALHTPGHTRGGMCFLMEGAVFTGDTLFTGSIGRSDLYGGDHETLIASIRKKLMVLPESTAVYPGHGPGSTIGREIKTNPFLR